MATVPSLTESNESGLATVASLAAPGSRVEAVLQNLTTRIDGLDSAATTDTLQTTDTSLTTDTHLTTRDDGPESAATTDTPQAAADLAQAQAAPILPSIPSIASSPDSSGSTFPPLSDMHFSKKIYLAFLRMTVGMLEAKVEFWANLLEGAEREGALETLAMIRELRDLAFRLR